MANTYTLISSQTLSTTAASVTFSSIPSTYTDLVLRISARGDSSGQSSETINLTINSNTATNYSQTRIYNSGGTATSSRDTNLQPLPIVRPMTATGSTTATFGNAEIYIPSYTVSQNKPIGILATAETNNSSVITNVVEAGLWRNTATISTLLLAPATSSNFVSGSSFYLYGIKNS